MSAPWWVLVVRAALWLPLLATYPLLLAYYLTGRHR